MPAVADAADPVLLAWLVAQADKGATIVSICDGALPVARAGLLKGHRATGHWATQSQREHDFPDTTWLRNTRYVADGKRISSAGISAAIPLSLALVEAIDGRERAAALAQRLGVDDWSASHDSLRFKQDAGMIFTAAINKIFSSRQTIGIELHPGMDDIALALAADAFSRTYRSRVQTVAPGGEAVITRAGLTVLADRGSATAASTAAVVDVMLDALPATDALAHILARIGTMYGRSTAKLVADQLEYPLTPR